MGENTIKIFQRKMFLVVLNKCDYHIRCYKNILLMLVDFIILASSKDGKHVKIM